MTDLGADLQAALPDLRAAAESKMVDSCTIVEVTTSGDPDPATSLPAETRTTIYAGKCEYRAADTQARSVDSGGRQLVQQGATLKIPVDAPGSASVRVGHVATISLATNDPTASPVVVTVSGTHQQTYATARRLPVEVTSSG
ncbi:DUF6093 family protein [Curtobacterium sp. DN_7.5]|uniref:DUF6093 family protein n=1 Tax=Curtobacterium sp. DN_7.5 TaxID=3049047 RepID=UPI001F577504|nr:DUF6093 family protein [Curtobacterium sp. DN_7.5]